MRGLEERAGLAKFEIASATSVSPQNNPMNFPLKSRWSCAAALLIVGLARPALAVPLARVDRFDQATLPPETWRLAAGTAAGARVHDKVLTLAPGTTLVRRYYPLRTGGDRPAFGDFEVTARFRAPADGAPLRLGLVLPATDLPTTEAVRAEVSPRFQLWVEVESQPAPRARLMRVFAGVTQSSEWRNLALPAAPDALVLVRQGNVVEAQIGAGAARQTVAIWRGVLPARLDFALATGDQNKNGGAVDISELAIEPLAKTVAYSRVLPQLGRAAPGTTGAREDYGFLWGAGDEPRITVRVSNMSARAQSVTLDTSVTDWLDHPVSQRAFKVQLAPSQEQDVVVPLAVGRFGTFHLWTALRDAAGAPLEARRGTIFGLTRAPQARDLSVSSRFGTHASAGGRVGAKWMRYWDAAPELFWNNVEPEKGRWTWSKADARVDGTRAIGMEPLVVLCGTPKWASTRPEVGTYLGAGALAPARDINDWSEYCRQLARHFKGRVRYYEVWNEPNMRDGFFYGSTEDYVALLQAASIAIKAEDPNAQILAPSGTGAFFSFLERVVELGGLDSFDICSIHTYTEPFPPENGYPFNDEKTVANRVQRAREIMARGGAVKPIWDTEYGFGWNASQDGVSLTPDQIALEAQPDAWPNWSRNWSFRPADSRRLAAFMPRMMMELTALGVEKGFFHHHLVDGDGEPRFEAPAWGFASMLLGNARFDRAYETGEGARAYGFELPDGRYALALWRVEAENLTMDAAREQLVQGVGSAPLEGAAQPAIAPVLAPPRATYFPPDRIVALGAQLQTSAPPLAALDLWGNSLPRGARFPVEEAPIYLIWARKPAQLALQIERGPAPVAVAPIAVTPVLSLSAGTLTAATQSVVSTVSDIASLLPTARTLRISDARALDGAQINGEQATVMRGQSLQWSLTDATGGAPLPRRARLIVQVRAGDQEDGRINFGYTLARNAEAPRALDAWSAIPLRTLERGPGYAVVRGALISPVLDIKAGDTLQIASVGENGRIYDVFLLPVP